MANSEHLEIMKQGVEVWNKWRKENPDIIPDLGWRDFICADHTWRLGSESSFILVDFNSANLSGVNFSQADLSKANLANADLSFSDLSNADLLLADLHGANVKGANLNGAMLRRADFTYADLSDATITHTQMAGTILFNTNLSRAKGLNKCYHWGPSIIDRLTLIESGDLPIEFLRGCGLSDWEIEAAKLYRSDLTPSQITDIIYAIKSLYSNTPIQFYSCFFSYSRKDQDFADRLYADLQSKGVRCWFAPEDLKIGDKVRDCIDESIRLRDKLLLILSGHSIASDWVEHEVERALEEEKQRNCIILFPIRLDDAVMESSKAWAALIRRTRHIGDFTRWKDHDSYQKAFDRLLRDLKAGE